MRRQIFHATSYGCDGEKILVTGPHATMKVPKSDAIRLAQVCLAQQQKYTLVNVRLQALHERWQARQLAALRKQLAKIRKLTNP